MPGRHDALRRQAETALEEAGLPLAVEIDGDTIVVTGAVDTDGERAAAIDIVTELLPPAVTLDEQILVTGVLPEHVSDLDLSDAEVAGFVGAEPGTEERERAEPGDFTDQPVYASGDEVQSATLSDSASDLGRSGDPHDESDGDEVFVPPIDPVGTDTQVLGGFQHSAMDAIEVERSSDGALGDEAIRDAILRTLAEDAATAGLTIDVAVDAGLVILRGTVADLDDVEAAEEVAARVPGVRDVEERLDLEPHPRRAGEGG